MKIIFNGRVSGLGNNGGSRTIILATKMLKELGHECHILAKTDRFTWFPHDPIIEKIPDDLDVVINIAAVDMKNTLTIPSKIKTWYIRAHENWSNSEDKLKELYNNPSVINIVNSIGLQNKLLTLGAKSDVIYQGIDLDFWKDKNLRPKNKIRIGCLYTTQPRKRWKDFVHLAEELGDKNYEYVGIGSSTPSDGFLTDFKCNTNSEELCKLYSSCHIWFAPTESEGLHNVPMEANLCGCLVV
jgi:glycosyltransferase involved in cell wall biosynthesis